MAGVAEANVFAEGGAVPTPPRSQVEADGFAFEFVGDVDGGAGAAHGVEDGVAFAGVAGEQLPDDPGGGGADVVFVAMAFAAVVLGGIFPEGGGEQFKRWFVHRGPLCTGLRGGGEVGLEHFGGHGEVNVQFAP